MLKSKVMSSMIQRLKSLMRNVPKNVFAMGATSFFNDISSEMIYPALPFFLTATLGVSVDIIGLIEGIAQLTSNFLRIFSGYISDKVGKRKPFVLGGYTVSTTAKVLFGLAQVWQVVLIGRFCDRFGKGVRTSAKDALMTASAKKEHRGIAFGVDRALDTAGAVIGPLLAAFFLLLVPGNYRLVFFIALIPALIGIGIFFWWVKDEKPSTQHMPPIEGVINGEYKRFLLVTLIFSLGNSSDVFFMLRAKDLGLTPIIVMVAYAMSNLAYAIFCVPCGILTDKVGPHRILMSGFFLFSIIYFFLGIISSSSFIWVLYPMYGLFMALTVGVGKANVSLIVPSRNAGIAFGLYEGVQGICQLFASLVAGFLWRYVGSAMPFFLGSMLACLAGSLALYFHYNPLSSHHDV